MGYLPCTFCKTPFKGKSAGFYPAIAAGSGYDKTYLRLCQRHAMDYARELDARMGVLVEGSTISEVDVSRCFNCGEPVDDGRVAIFVTGYPPGLERIDWFGQCHRVCVAAAVARLSISASEVDGEGRRRPKVLLDTPAST